MMNMHLLSRSGLAAIAAATAFIATPALAQDAAPATSDPAPIVADEPLTVVPLPTLSTPAATSDPLAPAATTTATSRSTRTTRPTRATTAPAARVASPAPRNAAPAAVAPAVATPTAPTGEALAPADPAMVAPLPEPVAAVPAQPASNNVIDDDLLPIAGAAGLGILALAGAGFAMRRRRRDDEEGLVEENWHEPAMSRPAPVPAARSVSTPAPTTATAPVAASAFGWNNAPREPAPAASSSVNRIEAAKRGPTPDNPSLSLKKRLKRAAFFDQRDRQIAAGMGAPISASAGLPDAMTPAATVAPIRSQPLRPSSHGLSMSFGKTFQPA